MISLIIVIAILIALIGCAIVSTAISGFMQLSPEPPDYFIYRHKKTLTDEDNMVSHH